MQGNTTRRMTLGVRVWTIGILLVLLAACAPIQINLAPPTPGTPVIVDELAITPLTVAPDDVAEILGIYRWRFHLTGPESVDGLRIQLSIQRPGQDPEVLADFGSTDNQVIDNDVLVAIYPIDGPIFQAEQLQYFVRNDGSSTTGLLDNPVIGYTVLQPHQPAEPDAEGGFKLLTIGQEFTGDDVITILLHISTGAETFDN